MQRHQPKTNLISTLKSGCVPAGLVLWNKKEEAACAYKGYANPILLQSGTNSRKIQMVVLRVIAESKEKLRRGKGEGKPSKNIVFVKEGTSLPKSQSKGQKNLISSADDWKLKVDLNKKLVFLS